MNEVLIQLIDMLKTMSPLVWQTLIKQVYSDGVASIIWAIILFIFGICLVKLTMVGYKKYSEDDDEIGWLMTQIFSSIGSVVTILFSFYYIISAIQHLFNPEFYAIQYIISQLK